MPDGIALSIDARRTIGKIFSKEFSFCYLFLVRAYRSRSLFDRESTLVAKNMYVFPIAPMIGITNNGARYEFLFPKIAPVNESTEIFKLVIHSLKESLAHRTSKGTDWITPEPIRTSRRQQPQRHRDGRTHTAPTTTPSRTWEKWIGPPPLSPIRQQSHKVSLQACRKQNKTTGAK